MTAFSREGSVFQPRRRFPCPRRDTTVLITMRLADSTSNALADPRIADAFAEEVRSGECRRLYRTLAWVVMPDHVHILLNPERPPEEIAQWLRASSGGRANRLRGRPGVPFWDDGPCCREIRDASKTPHLISRIEANPVRGELVSHKEDWPWSSASRPEPKGVVVWPPLP